MEVAARLGSAATDAHKHTMAAALPLLATCSLLVDPSIGRRAALATVPAGIVAALGGTREARALSPCPPGANNCLSTAAPSPVGKLATWKFPKGMDKAAAIDSLEKVLDSYPQASAARVASPGALPEPVRAVPTGGPG